MINGAPDSIPSMEAPTNPFGEIEVIPHIMDMAPHGWAVRFYSGKFFVENATTLSGKKFKLINLPLYMSGKLATLLRNIIG